VLAAAVAGLFLAHALYLAGVAEDAFISFRYARNLAAGLGFVWNPGDPPVEGYTNFLWVLLSAGAIAAGTDPLRAAQGLGILASLAALAATWRCGRLLGWSPAAALLPCLFLALSGPFAGWATGGLETNAYAAALVFAVFHAARAAAQARRRDPWLACGALFLALLLRPEGALAAAALLAAAAWAAPGRAAFRRAWAPPVLALAALFALYTAWRWHTFGSLLPNTFYAKTGGGIAQYARGARYVGLFALHYLAPWLPLFALALGARARGAPGPACAPLLVFCGALAAALALAVAWEGGDYMALYRFLVPVLPFLYLLLCAAARGALQSGSGARRAAARAACALAALGTLFHSTPLEAAWLPALPGLHGNWRGVQTERWHVARLSAIGRFFADYARPGESLASDAIGAVSWYSGLRVYDAHGLVDPVLARSAAAGRRVGGGVAGHDRIDWAHVFAKRPTFLMFRRDLRSEPLRRLSLNLEVDAQIAREYELRSVWLEDPANGEAGWFSFLERRERQPRNGVLQ
jgi:hypothetical protein